MCVPRPASSHYFQLTGGLVTNVFLSLSFGVFITVVLLSVSHPMLDHGDEYGIQVTVTPIIASRCFLVTFKSGPHFRWSLVNDPPALMTADTLGQILNAKNRITHILKTKSVASPVHFRNFSIASKTLPLHTPHHFLSLHREAEHIYWELSPPIQHIDDWYSLKRQIKSIQEKIKLLNDFPDTVNQSMQA